MVYFEIHPINDAKLLLEFLFYLIVVLIQKNMVKKVQTLGFEYHHLNTKIRSFLKFRLPFFFNFC